MGGHRGLCKRGGKEGTRYIIRKRGKNDKDTCQWKVEVQESVARKKEAKKRWDLQRDEGSRREYKIYRREAKRTVARARAETFNDLYDRLNTTEGRRTCTELPSRRTKRARTSNK